MPNQSTTTYYLDSAKQQRSVTNKHGKSFYSYNTFIVHIPSNGSKPILSSAWNYSNTTGKYRAQFIGESTTITRAKLRDFEYLYQPFCKGRKHDRY